jgi:hypothetical protein
MQVSHSAAAEARQIVRERIAREPHVPRVSSWLSLASLAYRARDDRFTVLFGVFALAITLYTLFAIRDKSSLFIVMQIAALLFGLVCIATPGIYAHRVNRAIRHGSLATATALESQRKDGHIEGRLRVDHPGGTFFADFSEEAKLADDIKPGSTVAVLIDERRSKLLFVVGIDKRSSTSAA